MGIQHNHIQEQKRQARKASVSLESLTKKLLTENEVSQEDLEKIKTVAKELIKSVKNISPTAKGVERTTVQMIIQDILGERMTLCEDEIRERMVMYGAKPEEARGTYFTYNDNMFAQPLLQIPGYAQIQFYRELGGGWVVDKKRF